MGIVSRAITDSNMKFLLVVAFAAFACAEPEADPAFAYSTAGVLPYAYAHHALPYALPYAHAPVVYAAGFTNNAGALVPCAHGGLVAPAVAVEKREAEPVAEATADAEADPEADPWVYYSGVCGRSLRIRRPPLRPLPLLLC